MEDGKAVQMNVLTLAFLGDAVYSLFVRSWAVSHKDVKPNEINKICNGYVKASSQAKAYRAVEGMLDERELSVAHRARNAHPSNRAKNASLGEYMQATALEAVFGYLYITERNERLNELQKKAMEVCDEQSGQNIR